MPKYSKIALFSLAALAGPVLGAGRWHVIILTLCGMLAVPLGLVMGVWLVIGLKRDAEVPISLERTFRASMAVLGYLLIPVFSDTAFRYYRMWEAHSYVADMVPRLEEYRAKTGSYPKTLSEIQAPAPPALLARGGGYSSGPDWFHFEYWPPFSGRVERVFSSRTRRWEEEF